MHKSPKSATQKFYCPLNMKLAPQFLQTVHSQTASGLTSRLYHVDDACKLSMRKQGPESGLELNNSVRRDDHKQLGRINQLLRGATHHDFHHRDASFRCGYVSHGCLGVETYPERGLIT